MRSLDLKRPEPPAALHDERSNVVCHLIACLATQRFGEVFHNQWVGIQSSKQLAIAFLPLPQAQAFGLEFY